jgi:anti-sigma B factor antagonist
VHGREDPPGPGTPLHVVVEDRDSAIVITASGEVDYNSVRTLRKAVELAVKQLHDRPLVLDLTAVGYLGSAGIAALVESAEAAEDGSATFRAFRVVVDEARPVIRPLEIAGLDRLLSLYHDLQAALVGET